MIEASFGPMSREAAIDGAYQYDTGQRLRLSGLPSPDELKEADDMLSGDTVAVQVQYSYQDEVQTQMRLAEWDEDRMAWVAAIPDAYLRRHEPVNVYVYVSYGADNSGSRNKTMYTGVYTPISRPAPGDVTSEDQLEAWATLEVEVNLKLVEAGTAAENATGTVEPLNDAAEETAEMIEPVAAAGQTARTAAERLDMVEARFGALDVRMVSLDPGATATAALDGNALTLGVPRGEDGDEGSAGEDGPSDMTFSFDASTGALTITTIKE